MSAATEKRYRAIDVELVQRMVEPLEEEIKSALATFGGSMTPEEAEAALADAMERVIFGLLDHHPEFSAIADSLEEECNKLGVSLYAAKSQ